MQSIADKTLKITIASCVFTLLLVLHKPVISVTRPRHRS